MSKVGINSYTLSLPKGCRLHPVFHYDLLYHATSFTSRRPHQADIEGDHENTQLTLSWMSKLKIGQEGEVLTCNF